MNYELLMLIKPLTNEDVKDKVLAKVEKFIKDAGGKLTIKEMIGKRLLAYDIKQFKEGFYVLADVELPVQKITELRSDLGHLNELLRFLLIKKD